ncbi:MAG: LysE family translocator [Pseudomonadota bacterium]|nr:LysE family translocator [Pseudomonadota bacterium]
MSLSFFFYLAFAHLVAVISPGPDFFYILRSSFENGLKNTLISAVGIGTGVLLQCIFCLFALTYLYDEIPQIYLLIGTVGAGYLFYIGLVGLRNNSHESITIKDSKNKRLDILKSFFGGLFVNLLNVKAIVFFVSLFGGIINVMTLSDMVATSLYFFLATALWFIILSISLAYGKKFFISEKFQKIIKQFSSLSLMIIGVALGVYVWT